MSKISKILLLSLVGLILSTQAQAQRVLRSQTVSFDNYTALKAVPEARFSAGHAAIVSDTNRSGMFIYVTTDQTTLATADPQECVFVDPDGDPSNGGWVRESWLEEKRKVSISDCGAVPDDQSSGVQTANVTAAQAAIDLIAYDLGNTQRGGEVFIAGAFYLNGGLTIASASENINIKGLGVREVEQPWSLSWDAGAGLGGNPTGVFYNPGPSALIFSHTTGDAIRVQARTFRLHGVEIMGTFGRFNGGGTGSGIRCEAEDSPSVLLFNCNLSNFISALHPEDGVQIVGFGNVHEIADFNTSRNGRHGIVVDRGYINNRTNIVGFTGQVDIRRGVVYSNKSHGIVIGAPDASGTHAGPYRIKIFDVDSSDNAYWPTATRYSERTDTTPDPDEVRYADMYIDGENVTIEMSAFSGRENTFNRNLPAADHQNDCLHASGNNIRIINSRFIACNVPLVWGNGSGATPGVSEGLVVESPEIIGGAERPFFLEVPQQAKNARVNIHRDASGTISKLIYDGAATDPETFPGSGVNRDDRNNIVGSADLEWNGERFIRNGIEVYNTITKAGPSSTLFTRDVGDSFISMTGGSNGAVGGTLQLYGESNAVRPNEAVANVDKLTVRSQDALTTFFTVDSGGFSSSVPYKTISLNSSDFEGEGSTATVVTFGGGRRAGWAFDQTAIETVSSEFFSDVSGTYDVYLLWTNGGAGSGDVVWSIGFSSIGPGENTNVADSIALGGTYTAGAQDILQVQDIGDLTVTTGDVVFVRPLRNGGDGGDTLANDAILIGLAFVPQ